jgi:hypothetical protein
MVKNEPSSAPNTINANTITSIRIMTAAGLSMALSYRAGMSSHMDALEIKTGAG